jgi:hypothetical protein
MLNKPSQTKVRATSGARMLILLVARALLPAIDPRRFLGRVDSLPVGRCTI